LFEGDDVRRELADAVRAFCADALAPTVEDDDEHERFRRELLVALGEQGFCGVPTPEAYGGLGLGYRAYAAVIEEIAAVSASWAVSVAVTGLPQVILATFGSEAQRDQWLPGLASGRLLGAFALSEAGSGSDAAALRTTARRDGAGWRLDGQKSWITHGGVADVYVVMARTGGPGPRGISAFLVPGDAPGLSFGRKERKMGLRASPTVELRLDGVLVPDDALVAGEGQGFTVAMTALDSGRITIASTAVGVARAATEHAARYATERRQFDQAIIDFQGVGFLLADMACAVETSRLLVDKAAFLKDGGQPFSETAAMAKVVATDAAMRVTTDAVQVLGGYGYTKDHPVERWMRDAKVLQIVEGTNQIQRVVIARALKRRFGA
jgi:alkylation response protein AidB-like acyl-CoA dehydrogenase